MISQSVFIAFLHSVHVESSAAVGDENEVLSPGNDILYMHTYFFR